jgi:hypothetical protein
MPSYDLNRIILVPAGSRNWGPRDITTHQLMHIRVPVSLECGENL